VTVHRDELENELENELEDEPEDELEDELDDDLEDELDDVVEDELEDDIEDDIEDEIEGEIAAEERAPDEDLEEPGRHASAPTDWRAPVREHPMAALGLAVAAGVFLGTLDGSRRPDAGSGHSTRPQAAEDDDTSSAREVWDDLKGAALSATTAQMTEFLVDLVVGIQEEFDQRRRRRRRERRLARAATTPDDASRED
jgi:ElaB/YqjD/DUF883 family membrane-anchored ribosome-binding protein